MRVGVLASGGLGLSVLEACHDFISPSFIATDSKSAGIIEYAEKKAIPLFRGNPRNGKLNHFLKDFKGEIDVIFSINYLFLIEQDVISQAKYVINFHGSLLPLYRGRTPHVWAIINNERKTGVTAHLIDIDCDTGDIVLQEEIVIESEDTGNDILKKFEKVYPLMLKKISTSLSQTEGKLVLTRQDHSKATFFGKRTPEDGQINWNWQKERIKNWVRAQAYPYPGAFTYIDGNKVVIDKIQFSDFGFNNLMPNGLILQVSPDVLVKTPNGVVTLTVIRDNKQFCNEGKIFENED